MGHCSPQHSVALNNYHDSGSGNPQRLKGKTLASDEVPAWPGWGWGRLLWRPYSAQIPECKGFLMYPWLGARHVTMWMRLGVVKPLMACAGTAEPGAQATPGAGGFSLCRWKAGALCGARRVGGIEDTGGSMSSLRPNCWAPGSKWSLSRVAGAWMGLTTVGSSPSLSFGPERGPLPRPFAPWAMSTLVRGTRLFSGPLTNTPVSWPVSVFPEVEVEKPSLVSSAPC